MVRCKPTLKLNAQGPSAQAVLRLKPLAQAIALLMVAGNAQAATAFSSGWFADKGATQAATAARISAGQVPGIPTLNQQAQVNQRLARSISTLNTSVAAIAAQQAAQAAGRQAAFGQVSTIPDGLGKGGLQVDNSLTQGWTNAKGPTQNQSGGNTTVTIEQTADKAILNWQTFNVGRNTTVDFQQQSSWAVLNRVNDPDARPSEIQGQIKGAGTVMIINRNGVIFSGTSQTNVRNLVAAAATITDDQFTQRGLYFDTNGTQPTFTEAAGKVEVQRGALIQTHNAATSTDAGGYALLLGTEVENAGTIITAKGQATLAAGDSFYIRKGVGTAGNDRSTTRGNEVATSLKAGSTAGKVTNSGLIMASTGDITLTGHQVQQNGVALTSTSVDARGTIHLLNPASDNTGSVTLGEGSTTAILLDASGSTALNSQKNNGLVNLDGKPANLTTGQFNNLSAVADRTDQSRIEIVSGGTVDFQKGSITLATGGQVAVSAGGRSLVRDGAMIDVSGAVGVKVSMEANNIKINVQGNEQRDAPVNRDGGQLINNDVWVDLRELVFVPAGTNGYATDRWYTAGGLLEVGGYLGTQGHSVGEWMAQGGTVTFTGKDVVTQKGAQINLSGGTVDVQAGYIQQTWLKGPDGRLYEVSKAPGDILYSGFYKGFEDTSKRWGQTEYYYNPMIASQRRYEAGYSVGRDAGKLVVGTTSAVLEGQLISDVFQGDRQTQAPNINLDGYQQSQKAMAQRAQLIIGQYTPIYNKTTGTLRYALGANADDVLIAGNTQKIADGLDLTTALSADRRGKMVLDSDQLNGYQLGAIKVGAKQITVNGALKVTDGGDITLFGPELRVNANLTAQGGSINAGNILNQVNLDKGNAVSDVFLAGSGRVYVAAGVKLDASGRWNNLPLDPSATDGVAYLNGGKVSLRGTGDVNLGVGSLVDVSSGAAIGLDGKFTGGKGGNVTLGSLGDLALDAEIRGYGVSGGGTLALQARKVQIGDSATAAAAGTLKLSGGFFDKGFSAYDITGNEGLIVTDGTQVDVTLPAYRVGAQASTTPTGSDPATVLERWTPPLYQEDAANGVLTQRRGAGLSLNAGNLSTTDAQRATTALTVGQGAVITVDPGQAINLRSVGQLTMDGTLNAWGGSVNLGGVEAPPEVLDQADPLGHGRSIWLGEHALIDVSARAATAVDNRGRTYGFVHDGGTISLGGTLDLATGIADASDVFVVVRDGARLEASGAQALLNVPGQGAVQVASNGGSISLASLNGLYLDGSFVARAGGAGAAGGSLTVALESPNYNRFKATDRVLKGRELLISQMHQRHTLADTAEQAADSLEYGHGRLGIDQINAGGFDNLALMSNGLMSFEGDIALHMGQSLRLYSAAYNLSEGAGGASRVNLSAPYVLLAGMSTPGLDSFVRPVINLPKPSLRATEAQFNVDGNLIDVRDSVLFGVKGSLRQADQSLVSVERRGFDQVNLTSQGDLRFLAGANENAVAVGISTQLLTQGDMTLRAAQLYPATGASARIIAGYQSEISGFNITFDPSRTLTIGRTGSADAPVPYSVFGRLQLGAATVRQGGVVRAPLGLIDIGSTGSSLVQLLPGSLTSVSGKGLVLPYGGTLDGQVYKYDGKTVTFLGQGGLASRDGDLNVGVILGGKTISVLPDATLDLSGGGELLGAGFVSGRGGSTDARYNPLVQFGANGGFVLPGLSTNPVYAIVPGVQPGAAPVAAEGGAVSPLIGQQVTVGAGVPGLPAGTYTLMPSTYALMPGAFRVEINGAAGLGSDAAATLMRNGSWTTSGQLSIAHTGISNSVASQLILTSADTLRRYSQYNETSYAQFARADAARLGVPRPILEADAKTLKLALRPGGGADAFTFAGIGHFDAAAGGYGGTVAVVGPNQSGIEVVAADRSATTGFAGITLKTDSLNALGASRLIVGGMTAVEYGQSGNFIYLAGGANGANNPVTLREGATLAAPEVFLVSGTGAIVVEQGASINTLGRGKASYDARDGFIYQVANMLAMSNGLLNVIGLAQPGGVVSGGINLGACTNGACSGQTGLYSDGSIVALTDSTFQLGDQVRYGTRHLNLGVNTINLGSVEALAAAAAGNRLPAGLILTQSLLDRLLRGDTQFGAPALETLQLSARDGFNFYGNTALDTYDPLTGKSLLSNLMLSTPALYGAGGASDVATIHTANLIWLGAITAPGAVVAGGAGTGSGRLDINAERIEFGYGAFGQPSNVKSFDRLALGFANVNLNASERITANHKGSLSVYQQQGAYDPVKGFQYSGGNLTIRTPLMTGEAGSVNKITAGGAIDIGASAGPRGTASGQGAELSLQGDSIRLASAVVLPSGKVSLSARGDVVLTDGALIDVAGRAIAFNDVTQYGWGGDVLLDSRSSIFQAAGSTIDLSAKHNQAGKLRAVATDAAGGIVDLQGKILGGSSGDYMAGGTSLPYQAATVEIQAQRLGSDGSLDQQFADLNQRLNQGEVFGARSFQLKQGDLTIGNGLKAGTISVSVDNGSLRVNGRVDASGARVGSIALAGKHGLTLDGTAVLDAHGSTLRVDSYGKIIDSPNRAMVVLNSGTGQLTLADGVRIDLRHGTAGAAGNDGRNRGTLELNAPRLFNADGSSNDIAVDASGHLAIQGARSITLNGMATYDDAPEKTDPTASGRPYQAITQDYLNKKDELSVKFINAALLNNNLRQNKLAGLNNATYADAFHLRPGVEIVSKTPDGDLVVQGDLDLSGFRYASLNPHSQKHESVYGSGESGSLTLRAGGDLNIYGSINDGFAPPPETVDDKGWVLLPGVDPRGGATVVPDNGVTLADGTAFPAGVTLNYDVPIKGLTVAAGTRLPVAATLGQDLVLPVGTVLAAAVRDAGGNLLFAAGTLLSEAQTLVAGTQLDAGTLLTQGTRLQDMIWPKGVPLPTVHQANLAQNIVLLNGSKDLPKGALIPGGTDVKLPTNVASVQLRTGGSGQLWAISPMLAEGSQSWSLRLVAGADTEAADSRILQAHPRSGNLQLADSHYGMFAKELPAKGVQTWTAQAVIDLGFAGVIVKEGDPIDQAILDILEQGSVEDFCAATPEYCKPKVTYVFTQYAVDDLANNGVIVTVGTEMTDAFFQSIGYPAVDEVCATAPDYCLIKSARDYAATPSSTRFSVIRTGTGDLELLSAGNLSMDSLYGVYTAGTSSAATYQGDPYNQPKAQLSGADPSVKTVLGDPGSFFEQFVNGTPTSRYRAWYPEAGGNLTMNVGGDLTGDITSPALSFARPNPKDKGLDSADIGNWLWRQGSADVATGGQPQPTAWWINFGSYARAGTADQMVGFTGFATLGGGDLEVNVNGNAGVLNTLGYNVNHDEANPHSQGLVLAVGSTGRVASDGSLQLTGGGDLRVRIGGNLNPASESATQDHRDGMLVNLRGDAQLRSATVGSVDLTYGSTTITQTPGELRAFDPLVATRGLARGGMTLVPGDATFNLQALGDLVVKNVEDPGRALPPHASPFAQGANPGTGSSWFTLWTKGTAIDLFSLGGNLTPFTQSDRALADLAVIYPSIVRATAAGGSLYYGKAVDVQAKDTSYTFPMLLAPGENGQLQFFAQHSIYGADMPVSQSGSALTAMATPWHPAFEGRVGGQVVTSNLAGNGNGAGQPLFAFGPGTATASAVGGREPARFYAIDGDLVGVSSGRIITFSTNQKDLHVGQTWYEGNGPVWMMAGRDIVSGGRSFGVDIPLSGVVTTGNLFIHNTPNDISIVSAGRDILYSNFQVAGPGLLELSAGGNILMTGAGNAGESSVTSLGAIVPGDNRPGAGIVMQAGVGPNGPDYRRFVEAYLDPINLAQPGEALSIQGSKVAKTYENELVTWLAERFGFVGDSEQARAYYAALPAEQQRIFARDVYFAELKAAGREYNSDGSVRQGSYIRGRAAIAALFPDKDVAGNPITYKGDITLFGGSGVHTNFGGSIQMLTPGGSQTFGIEGAAPPSTAGVITQGAGDIQLYSLGSILLGQSRIMTTFGGSIMGWTSGGDINAGRGSKTTVVYTPPKRVYDNWGNVSLSPSVPSTGAGIATLNPIPEVPAGDIDLIAPLGTIDAGEAGIRVSGNVNIAALHVVNAANIQTQGKSSGVPVSATVNTGAMSSASAAGAAASQAAEDAARSQQAAAKQGRASIVTVEVLSFGTEPVPRDPQQKTSGYNPNSPVQVLGAGPLSEQARAQLTDEERKQISL